MPGAQQREASAELAKHFKWKHIQVSDLLDKEVSKKTEKGKKIQEA
jgi:adenylate kinase family enzyme